jgi:3-oxoacyl-[acyl-carrier protein] reductase
MPAELRGKVALVTGVSRRAGIGAAIAAELADAGAELFVCSWCAYDATRPWASSADEPGQVLDLLRKRGATANGIELDLAAPDAASRLMDACVARCGSPDILVNNAAHWEAGGSDRVDAAQLDRHFAVNLRAATLLCSEFGRRHPVGRPGRIVNITSGQGAGPMPGELAYVVTKAGLDALTLTLAAELAPQWITVNAVDPGPTDTGWMTDEQRSALAAASATGHVARPEDTARVVRYLVSESAASVTGQILRVTAA